MRFMFGIGFVTGAATALAITSTFSLVELILNAQDGVWE